jgi:phospholipid/cholesterol/gamma-HCH transport system permease protein
MSSEVALQRSISGLGDRVIVAVEGFGDFVLLAVRTLRVAARPRFPWRATFQQFEVVAVRSTPIVALTALFTGMVLALQTAFALSRFGAKPYVGSIVGLASGGASAPASPRSSARWR